MAKRKFRFRRRRRSSKGGSSFGGLSRRGFFVMPNKALLKDAGLAAAASLGVNFILPKLPFLPAGLKTGYGRIATKAGVSLLLAGVATKAMGPRAGAAVAIGGLSVAFLDLVNQFRAPKSVSGFVEGYDSLGDDDIGDYDQLGDDDLGCDTIAGYAGEEVYA